MTVTEAIERYLELAGQGRPDEGLQVLIEASYEHSDPALEHEVSLCYEERGWARREDRSLTFGDPNPYLGLKGWRTSDAQALEDFEEALSWSERVEPLAGAASVLLRRDPAAAERVLSRAEELDPDSCLVKTVRARLHLARGEWEEAGARAEQVVREAPEFGAAHLALADARIGAGRTGDALRALAIGAGKVPGHEPLLTALARLLTETGDLVRAWEVWTRVTGLNRENADAWRGQAWVAAARSDPQEMSLAVGEAARLEPDFTRAWIEREKARRPELSGYVWPTLP